VDAPDQSNELAYISELRIGQYAAILLAVLVVTACVLATGFYYPNREDRLWPLVSRKPLPQHIASLDDSTTVTLTRMSCFGFCPEYTVRIFGSGKIDYVGIEYVCAFGAQTATADPREVRRLVEAMIASGFFDYSWKEGPFSTDAPTVLSILQHEGRSYALKHYHGDEGAPRWLRAMEDEIDRVAGTARWLPKVCTSKECGWRLLCPTPDGGVRDVTLREPGESPLELSIFGAIYSQRVIAVPPHPYLRD
jgi:Domain of unknown function (DUF6438)